MALGCRFLLLPALATAATVPEGTYSVHQGFIPQGSDIIVKVMSISQAKEECVLDPNCEGFTFEGSAEDMQAPRRINLKSKWKLQPDATSSWTSFHLQRAETSSKPEAEHVEKEAELPSEHNKLVEKEMEVKSKHDIEVESTTTKDLVATTHVNAMAPNQWMASDATSPKKSRSTSREAGGFVPVKATTDAPDHLLAHTQHERKRSTLPQLPENFPDELLGYPTALWIMWLLVGLAAAAIIYSCIVAVARMSRRRSVSFAHAKDLERQDPSNAARLIADKYAQLEVQSPMADTRSCHRSCSGTGPLRGSKDRSCTKQDCVVS